MRPKLKMLIQGDALPGGRPTTYSEEIADRIIEVLEQCGSVKAAREAGKVPERTYYDWLKRYPQFSRRIEAAQRKYRMEHIPADLVELANKRLREYLEDGVKEKYVKQGATLDPRGNIVNKFVSETTVTRQPPQWAIVQVLGPPRKAMDELEALKVLAAAGMASPDELEVLIEGIDNIKKKLIGIKEPKLIQGHHGQENQGDIRPDT